jgi:predicted nuclease of predicted toxin-antitoxin system
VKFLVDHQLPPALAAFFQSRGHAAQHVRELGLKQADDAAIWQYALANELVVVSKDEDFYFCAVSPGSKGRLVWVKLGNCRNRPLLEMFGTHLEHIVAALQSGSRVVEIC